MWETYSIKGLITIITQHLSSRNDIHQALLTEPWFCALCSYIFKRFYIDSLERERKGEGDRKRNINARMKRWSTASSTWIKLETGTYAQTGNWTSNPSVHRIMPSQLSHTGHGYDYIFINIFPLLSFHSYFNWVRK